MATTYWDGSTDTDWATAANWSDTLPVADDTIVFDGRMVTKPTTGMTDGGSVSDSGHANACTFDVIIFNESYTGGIGTAALPLVCAPDKIVINGSGTYHICCGGTDQSTEKTIPLLFVNNSSAIVYLYSNCNDADAVCTWTNVYVTAGTVYVAFYSADTDDQGCYVANMYLVPSAGGSVTVTYEKDAYDVDNAIAPNIYMHGGTLLTDSQVGTFHMWGGTVYYGSEPSTGTTVTEADMDITTLIMHDGTFYWNPDDTGDPEISNIFIYGGTFDASSTVSNDIDKYLGGGADNDVYLFTGGTMNLKNTRTTIAVHADTRFYVFGGTLTLEKGTWNAWAVNYS